MGGLQRNTLVVLAAVVGLVALMAVVLVVVLDPSAYKARLEAAASRALGLEVRVGGPLQLAWFVGARVTLQDVHVRNRNRDVAVASQVQIGVAFVPLLAGRIQVTHVAVDHARLTLQRDRSGLLNVESEQASTQALPALDLPSVTVTDASFAYVDAQSATSGEFAHCQMDMQALRAPAAIPREIVRQMSFTARVACSAVQAGGAQWSDLTFAVDAQRGVLEVQPLVVRAYEATGHAHLHLDLSGAVPRMDMQVTLPQLSVAPFFKALAFKQQATGRVDLSATLAMQGLSAAALRQSATGRISLRGTDITVYGSDLDATVARFESSQAFDLLDVSAFFVAGPLGLVVTRGYDLARVERPTGGKSDIRILVSDWAVARGIARAQDVALATPTNRIALKGALDLVHEQFEDVTVAVVDARGCVTAQQTLHGSLRQPQVDPASALGSFAAPALGLLRKGGQILRGGACDVFYAGTVAAPG